MDKKKFIITVDTEGDNLWDASYSITTKNAKYIPKFQNLCEKYGFKPVYLTNYEMINDKYFVEFAKDTLERDACEIGMHLHAWNSPPYFKINTVTNERSYLIEYPINIMDEKIKIITYCLEDKFNVKIASHRAGRWTTNMDYFKILKKYGYKIDCSVTPHINWNSNLGESGIGGSNYNRFSEQPFHIYDDILEVPMTIRKIRTFKSQSIRSLTRNVFWGKKLWMRPLNLDIEDMLMLMNLIYADKNTDYLEFMIHSSELMPGGSFRFVTDKDIELFYNNIEILFEQISMKFNGCTLKKYANL